MTVPQVFARWALTGGATGALDAIDGNRLADGDGALVFLPSTQTLYPYSLDADSAAAESSPDVISFDTNAGNKRFLLANMVLKNLTLSTGSLNLSTAYQVKWLNGSTVLGGIYADSGSNLIFMTGSSSTERARINNSAAFLIGATSPIGSEKLRVNGQIYSDDNISALTFTDRTPYYDGDAVSDIAKIKGKDGEIDHNTLPVFAQKKLIRNVYEDQLITQIRPVEGSKNAETEEYQIMESVKIGETEEIARDLGAMISIIVVALQQLTNRIQALETRQGR